MAECLRAFTARTSLGGCDSEWSEHLTKAKQVTCSPPGWQNFARRSLRKSPITPAEQAEAFFLLASNRLTKPTDHINTVDGGLSDAFLR